MSYAYYSGCSLHSMGEEYNRSFGKVCSALGIDLDEVNGWICCGSTPAHATSHLLSIALPIHNLALVERSGKDEVVVPCASCFSRFKFALHEVKEDAELSRKVNRVIGKEFGGGVRVIHPLEILAASASRIRARVAKDLGGIRAACYYGCLLTRPPEVMQFDSCEYPMSMDHVLRSAGIETMDWSYKTECCGATLSLTETGIVVKLVASLLSEARKAGANAIAVACPLCHANLDARQAEAEALSGERFDMPVFYFTELVGLAFGFGPKELGLDKHLVEVEPCLGRSIQGGA